LAACAEAFATVASRELGQRIAPHEVLIDAPPVRREIEINIEIHFSKEDRYRSLGEVSPVVQTLAQKQFDDYVKRVRIFVHPRVSAAMRGLANLPQLVSDAISATG
jgi:hypothetical protein